MSTRRLAATPRIAPWLFVAAILLSAVLIADSFLYWHYLSGLGMPRRIWRAIVLYPISRAFFFVAMTPVVVWAARRAPLSGSNTIPSLVIHLIFSATFGVAAVGLYAWLAYDSPLWLPYGRWALIHVPQWVLFYGVIVGATSAFDAITRSRTRERQAVALRARLAEAQLSVLRHQLHPHFVFNALQAVSTLLYRDPAAADALLGQLSALLRRLLDHLERGEVSLTEELAFVESYLAIERARLGERLAVSIDAPPELADCSIPPLLIQPLVENAVKHAVVPRREGGRVTITARRRDGRVEIEVKDDGPGLPEGFGPQRFGVGLRAASDRLAVLYGQAQGLSLENLDAGGVVARITVPVRTRQLARQEYP